MENKLMNTTFLKMPFGKFKFETLPYQRKISQQHVNRILNGLIETGCLPAQFIVNERGGKYHLLDGYHKAEACRAFIEKNKRDLDVKVEVYHNLTEDEERKLYLIYNTNKAHGGDDMLRPFLGSIPALDWFKENCKFPVVDHACMGNELYSYFPVYKLFLMSGMAHSENISDVRNKYKTVKYALSWSLKDAKHMKDFFDVMTTNLGEFDRRVWWWKSQMMIAICRFYVQNVVTGKLKEAQFIELVNSIKKDSKLIELNLYTGNVALMEMIAQLIKKAKRGHHSLVLSR